MAYRRLPTLVCLMFSVKWTLISLSISIQHWTVFTEVTEVFILVPALLGLKGNLEMTLASRLSTAVSLIVKHKTTSFRVNVQWIKWLDDLWSYHHLWNPHTKFISDFHWNPIHRKAIRSMKSFDHTDPNLLDVNQPLEALLIISRLTF